MVSDRLRPIRQRLKRGPCLTPCGIWQRHPASRLMTTWCPSRGMNVHVDVVGRCSLPYPSNICNPHRQLLVTGSYYVAGDVTVLELAPYVCRKRRQYVNIRKIALYEISLTRSSRIRTVCALTYSKLETNVKEIWRKGSSSKSLHCHLVWKKWSFHVSFTNMSTIPTLDVANTHPHQPFS